MRDSQHGGQIDRSADGVSALARSVVSRLVTRDGQTARPPDADLLRQLYIASIASAPMEMATLRPDLRRARVSETELADRYLPVIARQLGADWAADRASWAEVTIGVARMQALMREIGRGWAANAVATPASPTVLVVLPEGEQHSFGSLVLTGQLRRRGVSVQVQIGAIPGVLRRLAAERRFDCAMISVGCEEKLAFSGRLVKALKDGSGGRLPVAVGGAVLDRPVDVAGLTRADLVTGDLDTALALALTAMPPVGQGPEQDGDASLRRA